MIVYLDTSALVKRYFHEPYSDDVLSIWQETSEIVTSSVAYAEAMATFYRKKREAGLTDEMMEELKDALREDWKSFIRVLVNDELNPYIDQVIGAYPLRGFDAIHMASVMVIHEKFLEDFLFVCFDQRLIGAAQSEGYQTFP